MMITAIGVLQRHDSSFLFYAKLKAISFRRLIALGYVTPSVPFHNHI